FAELKDERAVDVALEWSKYGKPSAVRGAAIGALGKLGDILPDNRKTEVVDALIPMLNDSWFRAQISTISALDDLKDARAAGPLDRLAATGLDGRVVRRAREVAAHLRSSGTRSEDVKKLREEVDKLTD